MARGLVSGLAAGSVVAVLGLGGLSLVMPLPQSPAPGLQDPGQPAPAAQPVTAPATSPEAGVPSAGPATAIPLPEGSEFARTGADATPAPAQEALPAGEAKAAPAAPAPDPVPEAATPGTEPPARPTLDATPPLAPAPPQTAAAALEAAPEAEPAMPVPPPGEAEAPLLPRAEGEAPPPGAEITLLPDGALLPPDPNLPRSAAPNATPQAPARVGFADAQGTKVNRLPQVGAAAPAAEKPGFKRPPGAETAPETAPEAAAPEAATPAPIPAPAPAAEAGAEGGALARFAAPFTPQPGKPLFAVVLIDVGTAAGGLDRETIAALGPSVTVALSPARPGAAEDAAFYRAAGLEVAILADALPTGATAQDLEVSFADWHRTLPQAIALVEPPEPRVQTASKLVNQAVKALGAEGMAYVPQELGMASALQIAASAELPRASIWRVLDARRDKAPVVTRTLSRAAFEAAREGRLVVMISAWPESVAGLNAWRAEAAATLNLAPLSTVALQSLAP